MFSNIILQLASLSPNLIALKIFMYLSYFIKKKKKRYCIQFHNMNIP